jgi:hypothetical protein
MLFVIGIPPRARYLGIPGHHGIDPVRDVGVASSKVPSDKPNPPKENDPAEKPIRLNDLIPNRNVSGGRRAVFGSAPSSPAPGKRKPQK